MLDAAYDERSHPTDPSFESDPEEDDAEVG